MTDFPAKPVVPSPQQRVVAGHLRSTMLWLALPALGEQFLSFCVGLVDVLLSGQISREATDAVGTAAYIGWVASLLFGMVGTGTTALVSRFWGEGEKEKANRVANRSLALAAVLGAVACAGLYGAAPWLAAFLEMDDGQQRTTVHYLRLDAFGHLFFSFSVIGSAALRGAGDTRSPLLILGLVSLLNLVLSPLLVFGPGFLPAMGVDGIVTGTIIARLCGGALMLGAFARGISGLKISRRELLIRGDIVRRILRIGIPAAVDGLLYWTAQLVFLKIINAINHRHPGVYAAHMIGIELEALTYLPAVAWGYAAATMVGQALGAGDERRARRAGHEAARQCGLLAGGMTLLFFFGAGTIYQLLHRDALVQQAGIIAFRINALFQIPLAVSIIYVFALRGAGDTRTPLMINVLGAFLVRLPVAYVCGVVLDGGLLGAWIGMMADVTVRAVILWGLYLRGQWTTLRI